LKTILKICLLVFSTNIYGQSSSDLLEKSWESESPIKIREDQTLQAFQLTLLGEDVSFKENVIFQEAVISQKIVDGVHYATSASFSISSDSIHFYVNMDYWGFHEGDFISLCYKWVDENEILVMSEMNEGVFLCKSP